MIARNHVINIFRRKSLITNLSEFESIQNNLEFSENSTQHLAELNDLKAYIEKAKSHLTPRQAQIFELSKEQGLSNQEIADRLNISNQSVKNQLSTSLNTLHSIFDKRMWVLLPLLYFYVNERGNL